MMLKRMERSPVMNNRAIPTVITLIGLLSSGNLAEEMNQIYEQRAASNELPEDGVTVEDLTRSQRAKVNIRASTGAKVTYKPPRDKRGDFAFDPFSNVNASDAEEELISAAASSLHEHWRVHELRADSTKDSRPVWKAIPTQEFHSWYDERFHALLVLRIPKDGADDKFVPVNDDAPCKLRCSLVIESANHI